MKKIVSLGMVILLLVSVAAVAMAETVSPAATSASPEALLQQWYQLGDQLRANGNYPFMELRKGDESFEVSALQTRLTALGYYQKEVVDTFGAGTYNALRQFEKANGLTVDGVASVTDQQVLYGSTAIAYTATKLSSSSSSSGSGRQNRTDATSGATSN